MAATQAEEVVEAKRVNAGKSSSVEVQLASGTDTPGISRRRRRTWTQGQSVSTGLLWGKTAQKHLNGNLLSVPAVPSVENQLALLNKILAYNSSLAAYRPVANGAGTNRRTSMAVHSRTTPLWSDRWFWFGCRDLPWGDSNCNAGMIAALQAEQDVLASEQSALMQSLDAQLYVLLLKWRIHSTWYTPCNRHCAHVRIALSEAGNACMGQLSYNQYSGVRRELLSAQTQLLEALHLQHIEIQRWPVHLSQQTPWKQ